ncbi:biopolymer transporter ExbD [bacterium]|nr:biopolymer transporter ExbD [bacterium]
MFEDDLHIVQTPRIKHLWDVTNFIDIMIVLLIFLIATTTFSKAGIQLNQPESTTASALPPQVLQIDVAPDGTVYLDAQPATEKGIRDAVISGMKSDPNVVVDLRTDKKTRTESLLKVMDWCRESGCTKFSFGATKK